MPSGLARYLGPGAGTDLEQVLVVALRALVRRRHGRVLLGLDDDPARVADLGEPLGDAAEVETAVPRHREDAGDDRVEEAQVRSACAALARCRHSRSRAPREEPAPSCDAPSSCRADLERYRRILALSRRSMLADPERGESSETAPSPGSDARASGSDRDARTGEDETMDMLERVSRALDEEKGDGRT